MKKLFFVKIQKKKNKTIKVSLSQTSIKNSYLYTFYKKYFYTWWRVIHRTKWS